jgi:hypothetical protein
MSRNCRTGYLLFGVLFSPLAFGSEALLTITATGHRYPPPYWADEAGKAIPGIVLEFRGASTAEQPYQDVTSDTKYVRLIDALNYPASIALKQPQSCFIGNTKVGDNHVGIIHDGTPYYGPNGSINIHGPDEKQGIGMVFKSDGGYGRYSGLVTCQTDGSLTYTYFLPN